MSSLFSRVAGPVALSAVLLLVLFSGFTAFAGPTFLLILLLAGVFTLASLSADAFLTFSLFRALLALVAGLLFLILVALLLGPVEVAVALAVAHDAEQAVLGEGQVRLR